MLGLGLASGLGDKQQTKTVLTNGTGIFQLPFTRRRITSYFGQLAFCCVTSHRSRMHELENLLKHPDAIKRRQDSRKRQQIMKAQQLERLTTEWWASDVCDNLDVANTPEEFEYYLDKGQKQGSLIVVKFFAPFCHACKTMSPKLSQIVQQHPEVYFIKFNVGSDIMRAQAEEYGVNRLPYFHIFKGPQHLASFSANLITISRLRRHINIFKTRIIQSSELLQQSPQMSQTIPTYLNNQN
eukprot:TRINITY_DN2424_c0_g1_i9.p5 TRINITY_DN2424_c0_g1~~TRINITY_DN2424_c0_g1_i9.p5  ORF type:complete len:240 (-),score=4.20 TRINITY_DN2424_c0_g1_i9:2052-2771(-)